jgi:hypothetical protein
MDILNFKFTSYEVGMGVNFQKMPSVRGSRFLKMYDLTMYIYIYMHIPDLISTPL